MKLSQLFTKTKKEAPKDEISINAQLLTRAGFIFKEMAGVYTYLPLGILVLKKIENIIREEMNAVGGIEMKTSVLQSKEIWEKSGRWDDKVVDNWFKTELKNGTKVGLSFTNEEAYSNILKQYLSSYKDLPIYPYDFKEIFRNETRSKSGIMRGREFYWKALYSFSKDEKEHNDFYEKAKISYQKIYNRVGIGNLTYLTFASGGTFSKFSHEFQTICDSGEDIIYIDKNKKIAINNEVYTDDVLSNLGLEKKDLSKKKAIEVGNIFTLGTKFSEPFNLKYADENGKDQLVFMGSYGIGLSRLMGTIVEVSHDDQGIIWPESVAPYKYHVICLKANSQRLKAVIDILGEKNCLIDDKEMSAGEKFADADLMGMPYRIVISEKTLAKDSAEIKKRNEKQSKLVKIKELKNI